MKNSKSSSSDYRPVASDFLIVQVWNKRQEDGGTSIGGAKIPVAKIRFPLSVTLGIDNAKLNREEEWMDVTSKQDVWVQATICSDQATTIPCPKQEQLFKGEGISKLLNELPGFQTSSESNNNNSNNIEKEEEEESTAAVTFIRVPASLILEKNYEY